MKLCVFGNKTTTRKLLGELIKSGNKINSLVTLGPTYPANLSISGKDDSIINFALENNIELYNPTDYSLSTELDLAYFKKKKFDIGLSTGWQRLIPGEILNTFEHGVFGWHGSGFEFPNGRGRSPLNWSIRLGLNKIYHNTFRYSEGVDAGSIYNTKIINIEHGDYINDLQEKALKHIIDSANDLIQDLKESRLTLLPQPVYPFIQFPKLSESSGEIFIVSTSSTQALNIIRSCSRPFPGAYAIYEGKKYRIWRADICEQLFHEKKRIFILNNELFLKLNDGMLRSTDFEVII